MEIFFGERKEESENFKLVDEKDNYQEQLHD